MATKLRDGICKHCEKSIGYYYDFGWMHIRGNGYIGAGCDSSDANTKSAEPDEASKINGAVERAEAQ